jgi:hypothetical protein
LTSAAFDSRQVANKFKGLGFNTVHMENPSKTELYNEIERLKKDVKSVKLGSDKDSKKGFLVVYVSGISRFHKEEGQHEDELSYENFDILLPKNT